MYVRSVPDPLEGKVGYAVMPDSDRSSASPTADTLSSALGPDVKVVFPKTSPKSKSQGMNGSEASIVALDDPPDSRAASGGGQGLDPESGSKGDEWSSVGVQRNCSSIEITVLDCIVPSYYAYACAWALQGLIGMHCLG